VDLGRRLLADLAHQLPKYFAVEHGHRVGRRCPVDANGGAACTGSASAFSAGSGSARKIASIMAFLRAGLTTKSFMPAPRQASMSSGKALAVNAMMVPRASPRAIE